MATRGDARGSGPERAFCRPLPASGGVRLSAEEGHHLVRARRVRPGDEVVLFDGEGTTRLARLLPAGAPVGAPAGDGPSLEILGPYPDREPLRDVALAVAFPKGGAVDDLVTSLATLGASLLVPLAAERCQTDLVGLVARRRERWQRLAIEACKVNGRSRTLRVLDRPLTLEQIGAGDEGAAGRERLPSGYSPILLDTDPTLPSLPEVLRGRPRPLLLIGPEGGFSESEVAAALGTGIPAASLGGCALTVEVAAFAAAAIALSSASSDLII